jgi:hypothetical protein
MGPPSWQNFEESLSYTIGHTFTSLVLWHLKLATSYMRNEWVVPTCDKRPLLSSKRYKRYNMPVVIPANAVSDDLKL